MTAAPAEFSGQQLIREVESIFSSPALAGISLGPTMNDFVLIDLVNGLTQWSIRRWLLDRMRSVRFHWQARRDESGRTFTSAGRILFCWKSALERFSRLMLPVIEAIGPAHCAALYSDPDIAYQLPADVEQYAWWESIPHDSQSWRKA